MKKILLINPEFNIVKENYDSSISVGLLSIASYLNQNGVSVEMVDGVRQKNYLDIVRNKIVGFDIAGISVMTMQIPKAIEVCRLIREVNPKCLIVWGGSHPTFFIRETILHHLVDVVCYGEGELAMLQLANDDNYSRIKGIAYKKDGKYHINQAQDLHNPAAMPLFNWDLVPEEILHKLYLVPSLTSRGCPHLCTFCINAILKNRWRARTAEQVLEDLKIISEKSYFKDKKIRFWDENFFVDINRAKKIVDGMIAQNYSIPWETTIRADYIRPGMVDEEFMSKLKKSGCYLLSFGAESGSPRILQKIEKHVTPEQIVNSAKMCVKYGIIPQYSFMVGLPGEEKSDMLLTFNLIDELVKIGDSVQILGPQAFRPYPGSTLYEECVSSGWKAPSSVDEWAHLAQNQLSYLAVKNFPWVKDKDFVEAAEALVRFGAHSIKSALGSSIKAHRILKLGFILICKMRWKLKFFRWPIEFKIAKKFVTK